jgi:hypothetical protein
MLAAAAAAAAAGNQCLTCIGWVALDPWQYKPQAVPLSILYQAAALIQLSLQPHERTCILLHVTQGITFVTFIHSNCRYTYQLPVRFPFVENNNLYLSALVVVCKATLSKHAQVQPPTITPTNTHAMAIDHPPPPGPYMPHLCLQQLCYVEEHGLGRLDHPQVLGGDQGKCSQAQ